VADNFDEVMVEVKRRYELLLNAQVYKVENLPRQMSKAGIYLLSEQGRMLYVGRTNNLRKRLQYHTRNSHNQATLAFLLARRDTGKTKASYQKVGSRLDLLNDPCFRKAFDAARSRIRRMDVQFMEEDNPIKQALLELYVAIELKAEYNEFDTH
jgi:hypothetical protein